MLTLERNSIEAMSEDSPGSTPVDSSRRALIVVFVLAAIVRLALLYSFRGEPIRIDDETSYNEIAVSIVQHGKFATASGMVTSLRPPLYPALVAAIYSVCGLENYDAVRAVQAIISLFSAGLLYRLGWQLYGRRVALLATAFYCFYPSLLVTTCLLLTETLFVFWVLLICVLLGEFLRTQSMKYLVGLGIVLGLASLTRSILWLFPPILVVVLVFASRRERITRIAIVAAIPVLTFVAVLTPWSMRNTRIQKTFTTIDVMGGRNLMMGNYEHTPLYRAWDAISLSDERAWYAVLKADDSGIKPMTQGKRDKLAMRYALSFMAANPWLTCQRSAIKFFNFWQLERELVAGAARGYWGVNSHLVTLAMAVIIFSSYVLMLIPAIAGFLLNPPIDRRLHWFLLLLVAFICGIHTLVFAHSRYHLPLMPLVCIYAAATYVHGAEVWRNRVSFAGAIAGVLCLVLIASWLIEISVVDLAHARELFSNLFGS